MRPCKALNGYFKKCNGILIDGGEGAICNCP
jgi:hypothetical protein